MHASTLYHEVVVAWHSTDYSKGAKGRKVILQTKNTHKNHWTYTTGCPFYYATEHGSLESLHPPVHLVTVVMLRGIVKETSCIFNNSQFSNWQRRYRICTERMKMNHSSILHFPTERPNNLRCSTWTWGEDVPVPHKEEGLYPAHLHSFSHSPPPCLSLEVTCLPVVL